MGETAATDRWARLERVFNDALERPPADREPFARAACADDPALASELAELLRADSEAEAFLGVEQRAAAAAAPFAGGALPRRLGAWRLVEVLGEGGMGLVYGAERADGAYEQRVAVKVLRPGPATEGLLARFAAERRTLARLEHPGIARVVDAGEDEHGAPWIAMERVDGEPLDRWCDARGLSLRERVTLVAEVCDAVAHAHDHLVVHRDLKPANVAVDGDGRPRLLDFGIAKVLGDDAEEALLTATGERPMTLAYASPEQVVGDAVGVRSDVYSLGVVLYELACGRRPFRGEPKTRGELERAIREEVPPGPSTQLGRADDPEALARRRGESARALRRRLAGDLDRICLTALRKEPEARYASAAELAADLRAWLDGRPVAARGAGLGYRASKLVARHPVTAALAAVLVAGAAVGAALFVDASLRDGRHLAEIQRLGDAQELGELLAAEPALWPASPERVPDLEAWLHAAHALQDRRALHADALARFEADAGGDASWREWAGARLAEHLEALDRLASGDPYGPTLAAVGRRLADARALRQRTVVEPAAEWAAARERVAADPRFAGLDLAPQLGLVPLGPDPVAGLEAFWVYQTGGRPERDADGRPVLGDGSGVVLLLVPGGEARLGAQSDDPGAPRHDPLAEPDEAPVHAVRLGPYLLSKYEWTQGQWLLATGANPSDYQAGSVVGDREFGPRNPVERVSQERALAVLARFGLDLPTEAQWEHAARAGTDTPWSTGGGEESLAGHANLADRYARGHGGSPGWVFAEWADDGHTVHAPVGGYAPNPFGLHDVHGNVWEWTRDRHAPYAAPARDGDGLREADGDGVEVVARGGGFYNPAVYLRSAERYPASPTLESRSTGVRAARALDAAPAVSR